MGERRIYNPGDLLTLNCSSGKSHPASSLHWFINGVQVSVHIPSKYGLICLWALNKVTLDKWYHVLCSGHRRQNNIKVLIHYEAFLKSQLENREWI